jgi:O-antigen/teichoic acid export membrane protein
LTGVLLATALVLVASIWAISRRWVDTLPTDADAADFPVRMIVPVVAGTVGLTTMTQIDLVLVNRFFDPASAGQYTPASIVGKAVLYLPGGLVTAILPIVAARHARSEHSTGHAFQAIVATSLVCGTLALAYWAAGPWFVRLLYGEKYGPAGNLLTVYGPAMFPMAVAMVIQGFLLAKGRTVFCWVAAVLAAVELAVLREWHPSLHAVIGTMAAFNTTLAVVGGMLMVPEFRVSAGRRD